MNIVDKLYCHFYIYCRQKAWFVREKNPSYTMYAKFSCVYFLNILLPILLYFVESFFQVAIFDLKFNMSMFHMSSIRVVYIVPFLSFIVVYYYFLKNGREKALIKRIDLQDEEQVEYFYRVGRFFLIFMSLLVVLAVVIALDFGN